MVRAGHPLAGATPSLEDLADVAQVVLRPGADDRDSLGLNWGRGRQPNALESSAGLDEALARAGLKAKVAVSVHDVYGALAVVARTDMMVLAPRRLAELHGGALGLTVLDTPLPIGIRDVETVWSRDAGTHPAVQWLRQIVREAGTGL